MRNSEHDNIGREKHNNNNNKNKPDYNDEVKEEGVPFGRDPIWTTPPTLTLTPNPASTTLTEL